MAAYFGKLGRCSPFASVPCTVPCRAVLAARDRRALDPTRYPHLRAELGLDDADAATG